MSMQELEEEFKKDEKAFKDTLQKEQLSVVGIILDMRKIITKTGKNMMFLYCEWFDYDFEVTIFDRDYAEYKDKLEIWKVVIVEWNLDVNFEYGRKNIRSRKIITASLTQVRDQAKDMWLIDNVKRKMLWAQDLQQDQELSENSDSEGEVTSIDMDSNSENSDFEWELDAKISENKSEKPQKIAETIPPKYIIEIPEGTKLEQIHRLKDFLNNQTPGTCAIYIYISWKEVDTKFSISNLQELDVWTTNNL